MGDTLYVCSIFGCESVLLAIDYLEICIGFAVDSLVSHRNSELKLFTASRRMTKGTKASPWLALQLVLHNFFF